MMVLAATPMMSDPARLAALYSMNKWHGKEKTQAKEPAKKTSVSRTFLDYSITCTVSIPLLQLSTLVVGFTYPFIYLWLMSGLVFTNNLVL